MENQGASSPGILILTTSLSKPFMRLEKYVTLLQELERHMEVREGKLYEGHVQSMGLCRKLPICLQTSFAEKFRKSFSFQIYWFQSSLFPGF